MSQPDDVAARLVPARASRSAARRDVPGTTTASAPAPAELVRAEQAAAPAPAPVAEPAPAPPAKPKPRPRPPATTTTTRPPNVQTGDASYYEAPAGTCAHKSLPMGTMVRVTRVDTGASVVCKVADRGPYLDGRVIDLDRDDFARLAPPTWGVIGVRLEW